MIELIGFLGALGIGISWIPETLRTFRTGKTGLELKFILIYVIGCIFLVVYSFMIKDMVFIVLNSLALVLSGINLYFTIKGGKHV